MKTSVILTLLFFAAACYGITLAHPFVHDDVVFIAQNPRIMDLSNLGDLFYKGSVAPDSMALANAYYRPFLEIVYRIEYFLFGASPSGYHLVNVILHLANAIFVYILIRRLTERAGLAFCGSLLFLVHPVQSEAVACISGISNLLCMFFLLTAFLLYLRIADRTLQLSWPEEAMAYGAGLFMFACALMTKEQAAILPVLLCAYEFCFPQVKEKDKFAWRLRLAGFVITAGAYLLWRQLVIGGQPHLVNTNWGEFLLRLKAFPGMLMTLAQTAFWPSGLHYYRSYDILSPWFWPFLSFVEFIVLCVLIGIRLPPNRRRFFGFGLCWFFVSILPTTSLLPLIHEYSWIAAFEHFLYLPLAGLILSVLIAGDYFLEQIFGLNSPRAKIYVLSIGVTLCAVITFKQSTVWSGEIPLFDQAVRYEKRMGRLHLLLAKAYYDNRDYDGAKTEYAGARDIMLGYLRKVKDPRVKPFYEGFLKVSYLGLAACCEKTGKFGEAGAYYEKVLRYAPDEARVWNNLGVIAVRLGHKDDAAVKFRKALACDRSFVPARKNLENIMRDQH